ncbi:MAG: peptidoglycan DD-metalloendopeptidase family protein [Gammaproteobacteria bacterium]|nr:peptidoglycan DD-metalloendopeptidase family protein [Gammaproteobacteria bacterium]
MYQGRISRLLRARHLAGLLLYLLLCPALASQDQKLKEVQAEIKRTEQVLSEQKSSREELQLALKTTETRIGELVQAQQKTEAELASSRNELARLGGQRAELQQQQKQQQEVLAQQLVSAYTRGGHDYAKLLLSQSGAGQLERVLAYYGFLNEARVQAIDAVKETRFALLQVEEELGKREGELKALLDRQQQERDDLSSSKSQRERALNRLQRDMKRAQQQLTQLQESEQALKTVIAEARQVKPNVSRGPVSVKGLGGQQGKLSWPVKGRLAKRFGEARQGGMRWKGVMLSASEGSPVYAVADGNVVYADWVKGFGLLLVVDHGEGYMSIYGHNQALLKQAGDGIRTGEAVALVGKSGGHAEPGLYFEIRHQGEAVDPARWCR